jgi:hypothetical protein
VAEHFADRHVLAVRASCDRNFDVLVHGVAELELASLHKQHDRHGRELLGQRSGVKDRTRRDRNAAAEVGPAVSALVDNAAVLDHGDGAAGRIGFVKLLEDMSTWSLGEVPACTWA